MEQTVSPTVRSTQCSPLSTQRSIQTSTPSTNSFFIGARTLWTALAILALAFAAVMACVATFAGLFVAGAFRLALASVFAFASAGAFRAALTVLAFAFAAVMACVAAFAGVLVARAFRFRFACAFSRARTLWTALAILALAFALLVTTVATLAGVFVAGAFRGASGGVATPLAIVRISRSGERERTQRERDDKRRRFSEIKRHFSITFLID